MRTLTLLDWKAVKDAACYPEYKWQVASYVGAWNYIAEHGNSEGLHEWWEENQIKGAIIVAFDKLTGKHKTYPLTEQEIHDGQFIFWHARQIYDIMGKKPSRFYGDESNPSVTTVLGIFDKPALVQWAANSCNEYWIEHLEEIRNPATTELRIQQIVKGGKMAHRRKSKEAKDIGSLVHEAVELHLAGASPDAILRGNDKAETAYLSFLHWLDTVKLEVVALEQQVIHPTLKYGGTIDCIAFIEEDK